MNKNDPGNFFEDFAFDQELVHATPRSVNDGDRALYQALYGSRFGLQSSDEMANRLGLPAPPLDDLLAFHIVFGKTVPDVSLNAIANLGYAACIFAAPVYAGDTLTTTSRVVGLKQNSNGKTGRVYVRSTGRNQNGETVLDYLRWVMVRKRDPASPAPDASVPDLPPVVAAEDLRVPNWNFAAYDTTRSGSPYLWEDYATGEKIDHVDAMTIEEAEHQLATRLYQNTAKVHFNQHSEKDGRFGRRIVYGGHIISIARALSFNGLANAIKVAAINGGAHTAPSFAGDTIYAWSEVLDRFAIAGRDDVGALRLRTVATKDQACGGFPWCDTTGKHETSVVLDLDYTVLMPRRS